ncbi:lysine-specific demethylase 8 [Colletotrichum tofieldiae]|nr:lysine-specific demethylase 8 [Colletotrichum tofieldiae]
MVRTHAWADEDTPEKAVNPNRIGLRLGLAPVRLGDGDGLGEETTRLGVPLEVAGAVEPGGELGHAALVVGDLVVLLHGQANVVEAVDEAVFPELLDVKVGQGVAVRVLDELDKVGVLGAVLVEPQGVEQGLAETRALDGLEELLGDDGVGVDVGHLQRSGDALQVGELGEAGRGTGRDGGIGVGLVVLGLVGDGVLLRVALLHPLVDVGLAGGGDGGLDVRAGLVSRKLPDVGKLADNGGGGSHDGGHEMRPGSGTLATLEVSVAGGRASLLCGEDVRVHAQAHAAASLAPLEAGALENLVQTLLLGLGLDEARAGDDHGALDVGRDLLALDDLGGGAQVLDAGICAGADEDLVDDDVLHGGSGGQAHVLEHSAAGGLLVLGGEGLGVGDAAGDGDDILGAGAPGDGGDDVLGVDEDVDVVLGVGVGLQGLPVLDGAVPLVRVVLGGQGAVLEVLEGDLVGGDHAGSRATLDGHVADGHAGLHAEAADDGTAELDNGTRTAGGADLANGVQDNVLGADTGGQLSVDLYPHVLAPLRDQALGGQDVLDLAGADAEGQGTEGAVGRGVTVTAHYGGAGEGEALLGADDVDDALSLIAEAKSLTFSSRVMHWIRESSSAMKEPMSFMPFRDEVGTFWRLGSAMGASGEGDLRWMMQSTYVVGGRKSAVRSAHFAASVLQALECLLHVLC